MRPSPSQSPLTADEIHALVADFRLRLPLHSLPEAMRDYAQVMDAALAQSLAGQTPACTTGCDVCCHQPLLLGFLELAWIYFSDPARFETPGFLHRVEAECAYLTRLRRAGAREPAALAARQFSDFRPCLLLGAAGACSVHAVRSLQCRNAFSWMRCTRAHAGVFGYGDLAVLGRRLRADIHVHFELARFDPPAVAGQPTIHTETAVFYLPEGLRFLRTRMPLDLLRPLFCEPTPG